MNAIVGYAISFLVGAAVVALTGWLILLRRKRTQVDNVELRLRLLRGAYMILEENWQKAIEEFMTVARDDKAPEDVYFVLGRLFRQMGQVERAVRLHQGLLLRHEDLSKTVRLRAMFELAEDYRSGGLINQSIQVYQDIVEQSPQWLEPHENLLALAIRHGRWETAAHILPRVEKMTGEKKDELAAHVYAQLALELIENEKTGEAKKPLKIALARRPASAHVCFAYARLHAALGKGKRAMKALMEGLEAEANTASLMLDEMRKIAGRFDRGPEFDDFLSACNTPHKQSLRLQQALRFEEEGEDSQARETVRSLLDDALLDPQIAEAAHRLRLDLGACENDERGKVWRCLVCGNERTDLDWFCPECSSWNSYFPSMESATEG